MNNIETKNGILIPGTAHAIIGRRDEEEKEKAEREILSKWKEQEIKMTDLKFKPVEAEDMKVLAPYFGLRPNKTCDSVPLDSFIWRKYYHVRYAIHENKALLWLMKEDGVMHSAMPLCKEEDLKKYFDMTVEYFNQVLHIPFKIYLADEEAIEFLHLKESEDFVVTEQEDLKDYLYDGEAMRKLSGKKTS